MTEIPVELVTSAVKEIVQQAQSLGLVWSLRLCTVVTVSSGNLTVVFDGDTVPISATNITGVTLLAGDRVYGLLIPQIGNFVIGQVDFLPGGLLGRVESTTVNVGADIAEFVIVTTPSISFPTAKAFRVCYHLNTRTLGGASNQAFIRFRLGTGTSGTTVAQSVYSNLAGFGAETRYGEFYLKNTSGGATSSTLSMCGVASLSINVTVTATTTDVVYLEVFDAGPATYYTSAFEI